MKEEDKHLLQNKGENLAHLHKMFFKSHDLSQVLQVLLLATPILLSIISISIGGIKLLDISSLILTVLALVYYIYYGRNQELFMDWGERYLVLYKEVERYYKSGDFINFKIWIEDFEEKINKLNLSKKPCYHIGAKKLVDKTIEEETRYANEKKPRRK